MGLLYFLVAISLVSHVRADEQNIGEVEKNQRELPEHVADTHGAIADLDGKAIVINLDPYDGMNEDQIKRLKAIRNHEKFLKEHHGHQRMHAEMLLILLMTMIVTQIVLVLWKKHYFDSYQLVTLFGMWLIPLYFSIQLSFHRMLFFWAIFTVCTSYVTFLASRKPLANSTPRRVYTYFTVIYKFTYFMTFFGYFLALIDFVGLGVVIQALLHDRKAHPLMESGLLFMFYGLYFGVLDRDFAEICAQRMASSVGYYSPDGMPKRALTKDVCAICAEKLVGTEVEKSTKLPCGHEFHEFCIRGWSIIGKKQTCPYCSEKVDLKALFPEPWTLSRQDILYSQLLDALRYLVVWQPFILIMARLINHALGLV
eukprot:m.63428 g.63428  ORF g.63428 m.63428 type:complete len:369 (+) comp23278_c0_seq1:102-1208(+)